MVRSFKLIYEEDATAKLCLTSPNKEGRLVRRGSCYCKRPQHGNKLRVFNNLIVIHDLFVIHSSPLRFSQSVVKHDRQANIFTISQYSVISFYKVISLQLIIQTSSRIKIPLLNNNGSTPISRPN